VDSLARDGVFVQDFSQLDCVLNLVDEDDHLVEGKLVNEINQLRNLLVGFQVDVVLLKSVQGQFALAFDQDLGRVAHEQAASVFNITRKGSGKHHYLLVVRGLFEDLLDVAAHI